jgi:hypothetical protein
MGDMNRTQLIECIKNGRQVTLQLTDAEVVSIKLDYKPVNAYRVCQMYKLVVKDPLLGAVYFSSFSDKFSDISKSDKISLKVTVTGIGDASEKYPDPILFAKALTRKGDAVTIARPVVEYANDLPNV